jgi:hypothetical protein
MKNRDACNLYEFREKGRRKMMTHFCGTNRFDLPIMPLFLKKKKKTGADF